MTPSEAVARWRRRWLRVGVVVAIAVVLATAGVVVARSGAEPTSRARDGGERTAAAEAPADASARAPHVVFAPALAIPRMKPPAVS